MGDKAEDDPTSPSEQVEHQLPNRKPGQGKEHQDEQRQGNMTGIPNSLPVHHIRSGCDIQGDEQQGVTPKHLYPSWHHHNHNHSHSHSHNHNHNNDHEHTNHTSHTKRHSHHHYHLNHDEKQLTGKGKATQPYFVPNQDIAADPSGDVSAHPNATWHHSHHHHNKDTTTPKHIAYSTRTLAVPTIADLPKPSQDDGIQSPRTPGPPPSWGGKSLLGTGNMMASNFGMNSNAILFSNIYNVNPYPVMPQANPVGRPPKRGSPLLKSKSRSASPRLEQRQGQGLVTFSTAVQANCMSPGLSAGTVGLVRPRTCEEFWRWQPVVFAARDYFASDLDLLSSPIPGLERDDDVISSVNDEEDESEQYSSQGKRIPSFSAPEPAAKRKKDLNFFIANSSMMSGLGPYFPDPFAPLGVHYAIQWMESDSQHGSQLASSVLDGLRSPTPGRRNIPADFFALKQSPKVIPSRWNLGGISTDMRASSPLMELSASLENIGAARGLDFSTSQTEWKLSSAQTPGVPLQPHRSFDLGGSKLGSAPSSSLPYLFSLGSMSRFGRPFLGNPAASLGDVDDVDGDHDLKHNHRKGISCAACLAKTAAARQKRIREQKAAAAATAPQPVPAAPSKIGRTNPPNTAAQSTSSYREKQEALKKKGRGRPKGSTKAALLKVPVDDGGVDQNEQKVIISDKGASTLQKPVSERNSLVPILLSPQQQGKPKDVLSIPSAPGKKETQAALAWSDEPGNPSSKAEPAQQKAVKSNAPDVSKDRKQEILESVLALPGLHISAGRGSSAKLSSRPKHDHRKGITCLACLKKSGGISKLKFLSPQVGIPDLVSVELLKSSVSGALDSELSLIAKGSRPKRAEGAPAAARDAIQPAKPQARGESAKSKQALAVTSLLGKESNASTVALPWSASQAVPKPEGLPPMSAVAPPTVGPVTPGPSAGAKASIKQLRSAKKEPALVLASPQDINRPGSSRDLVKRSANGIFGIHGIRDLSAVRTELEGKISRIQGWHRIRIDVQFRLKKDLKLVRFLEIGLMNEKLASSNHGSECDQVVDDGWKPWSFHESHKMFRERGYQLHIKVLEQDAELVAPLEASKAPFHSAVLVSQAVPVDNPSSQRDDVSPSNVVVFGDPLAHELFMVRKQYIEAVHRHAPIRKRVLERVRVEMRKQQEREMRFLEEQEILAKLKKIPKSRGSPSLKKSSPLTTPAKGQLLSMPPLSLDDLGATPEGLAGGPSQHLRSTRNRTASIDIDVLAAGSAKQSEAHLHGLVLSVPLREGGFRQVGPPHSNTGEESATPEPVAKYKDVVAFRRDMEKVKEMAKIVKRRESMKQGHIDIVFKLLRKAASAIDKDSLPSRSVLNVLQQMADEGIDAAASALELAEDRKPVEEENDCDTPPDPSPRVAKNTLPTSPVGIVKPRGRGRPRKNPLPDADVGAQLPTKLKVRIKKLAPTDTQGPGIPKKRGRPPIPPHLKKNSLKLKLAVPSPKPSRSGEGAPSNSKSKKVKPSAVARVQVLIPAKEVEETEEEEEQKQQQEGEVASDRADAGGNDIRVTAAAVSTKREANGASSSTSISKLGKHAKQCAVDEPDDDDFGDLDVLLEDDESEAKVHAVASSGRSRKAAGTPQAAPRRRGRPRKYKAREDAENDHGDKSVRPSTRLRERKSPRSRSVTPPGLANGPKRPRLSRPVDSDLDADEDNEYAPKRSKR